MNFALNWSYLNSTSEVFVFNLGFLHLPSIPSTELYKVWLDYCDLLICELFSALLCIHISATFQMPSSLLISCYSISRRSSGYSRPSFYIILSCFSGKVVDWNTSVNTVTMSSIWRDLEEGVDFCIRFSTTEKSVWAVGGVYSDLEGRSERFKTRKFSSNRFSHVILPLRRDRNLSSSVLVEYLRMVFCEMTYT